MRLYADADGVPCWPGPVTAKQKTTVQCATLHTTTRLGVFMLTQMVSCRPGRGAEPSVLIREWASCSMLPPAVALHFCTVSSKVLLLLASATRRSTRCTRGVFAASGSAVWLVLPAGQEEHTSRSAGAGRSAQIATACLGGTRSVFAASGSAVRVVLSAGREKRRKRGSWR